MTQTKKSSTTNKQVKEESKIVNDHEKAPDAKMTSSSELISKIVGDTTSKVIQELSPYLGQGGSELKEKQKETTSKQVKQRAIREMQGAYDEAVTQNNQFMRELAEAPKSDYRTVRIPEVYRKYFGSQLVVGINGSFVTVPVNNRPHRVHKDFYSLIMRKLEYEDDKISTMERTGNNDVIEVEDSSSLGN